MAKAITRRLQGKTTNPIVVLCFWEANNTNNLAKGILIPLIDDGLDEPEETFKVILSNPIYVQFDPELINERGEMELTGTIQDDDEPSGLWFPPMAEVKEGNPEETAQVAVVFFILREASGQAVSVDYATSDGSTTQEQDYRRVSRTLTWPAGEISERYIAVPILEGQQRRAERDFLFGVEQCAEHRIGQ